MRKNCLLNLDRFIPIVSNVIGKFKSRFSCQMDPLYPPGLDENRAVDDLYPAQRETLCSEGR